MKFDTELVGVSACRNDHGYYLETSNDGLPSVKVGVPKDVAVAMAQHIGKRITLEIEVQES